MGMHPPDRTCYAFSRRAFDTVDRSRNEWVMGLLAFGEGWHNNRHAFPRSAFHGLHWWQLDVSSYLIWPIKRLVLARGVYRIPPALLGRRSQPRSAGVRQNGSTSGLYAPNRETTAQMVA